MYVGGGLYVGGGWGVRRRKWGVCRRRVGYM